MTLWHSVVREATTLSDDIISTIGPEAAARFFKAYGGKQMVIPYGTGRPGTLSWNLVDLLGEDGYRKLTARFGGEYMTVPKNMAAALVGRNRQIVADHAAGAGMLDLIRRYNLTERRLRTILGRPAN